jgi:hypothetical protein
VFVFCFRTGLARPQRVIIKQEQQTGVKYIVSLLDPLRRLVLFEICQFCLKVIIML